MPPMRELMIIVEQGYDGQIQSLQAEIENEVKKRKDEQNSRIEEAAKHASEIDAMKQENALMKNREYEMQTEIEVLTQKVKELETREEVKYTGSNVEHL